MKPRNEKSHPKESS